jgi:hypothetical protein
MKVSSHPAQVTKKKKNIYIYMYIQLFFALKRDRYSLLKFQVKLSIPLRFYNIDMELLSSLFPSEQSISS